MKNVPGKSAYLFISFFLSIDRRENAQSTNELLLLQVVNVPGKNVPDITEDSLRDLLEAQGLSVHSVAFDSPGASETKRFAYVRLTPPTPQWLAKSEPAAEVRSQVPALAN